MLSASTVSLTISSTTLSIVRFLSYFHLIVSDGKNMTQVISSLSFAHSTWTMMNPILHKNVLLKGVQSTTMVVNGIVTKTSLQKLISVVNTVLEVIVKETGNI